MSAPFTTTTTNLTLTAHIAAVQEATEIIKNAYRFIKGGEAQEHIHYLCATVQDHIDAITISTEVPRQMRSYEMALESVREFALIPEGATPIETADILKDMLAPPELDRSRAGVVYGISRSPRKWFPDEHGVGEDKDVR